MVGKNENGLKFILDDEDEYLCGNIGLNLLINKIDNNIDTNLIVQLKQKNIISRNVWVLIYKTPQDGIIVFGSEPHFFDENNYFMSQYIKMYITPSKDHIFTSWSFNFDKIYANDNNTFELKETKIELIIDQGLIIGTQEYKKYIDDKFFNKYIADNICKSEIVELKNKTFGNKSEYYVYYCNKASFIGFEGKYSNYKNKPFVLFPDIIFFKRELNYTFNLTKMDLFEVENNLIYFLIIFEKSPDSQIWK